MPRAQRCWQVGTAHQIPEMAPNRWVMFTVWIKGDSHPRRARTHHTSENETKLKSYGLFSAGVFRVMFLSSGWLWGTGILENKSEDGITL